MTKDMFLEVEKRLQSIYKNAETELLADENSITLYIYFKNILNYSLSLMESKEGVIWIGGFSNINDDYFKPSCICEEEFDYTSLDKLMDDIDKIVKKLRANENEFYEDCTDALVSFGMQATDQERIYGKPTLIGD